MPAIEFLQAAEDGFAEYCDKAGRIHDPIAGEPTQYATPYHALCRAVLAVRGDADRRAVNRDAAARSLTTALDHMADATDPPAVSSIDRVTGSVHRRGHRDFFWPALLKAYRLLRSLGAGPADQVQQWAETIQRVEIEAVTETRPPSNWAMVWVSGEWLRMREGLTDRSLDSFDALLAEFFRHHLLVEQGLYQEPGHPNSYDLFTRTHLADILLAGYEGEHRSAMERLMTTGLRRSLAVQLSDGSLASAHRSTGQTWTLGAQVLYFTHARRFFAQREPAVAEHADAAAKRAWRAMRRWQREKGLYSPVENRLPPAMRVGYEGYTADAHYSQLALGFLAWAIECGFEADDEPEPGPASGTAAATASDSPPSVFVEGDPTHRALVHRGPYSVHLNGWPAPKYDGFGVVDVTFGTGRFFQFASSAHHQSGRGAFNLGLATRAEPGRSGLTVMAQQDLMLIEPIAARDDGAGVSLRARVRGRPEQYEIDAGIESAPEGVWVREATPGLINHKTLLVPYVRDLGDGRVTEVSSESKDGQVLVRFRLGEEQVCLTVESEAEAVVDMPHGFENRRGLCGLLRIDLRGPREQVRYRLALEQ